MALLARIVFLAVIAFAAFPVHADTAAQAYRVMGLETADVLTGTVLNAKVVPGPGKQVVTMTTFFTGSKDKHSAVNVRLDVFNRRGETLVLLYTRDFGAENDGNVADGNLQIVDLDADGVSDIYVSFDCFTDPLIEQRFAELILHGGNGFHTVWAGVVEYDATRAARNVPLERRDRYKRDIDLSATLRARGASLVFNKTVIAIAGERLDPPEVVAESFPLAATSGRN